MGLGETITLIFREMLLLLAVLNPLGNIPLFVKFTAKMDPERRARTLNTAVASALGMVLFFALVGDVCLRYLFGVTLAEFKIAGGILLFLVAARGVLNPTTEVRVSQQEERFLAYFPLAFPILVGPGTLAMTIILSQRDGPVLMILTSLAAFVVVFAIVRGAPALARVLGPQDGLIIARLLYIFLAAKAVSLVLTGLRDELKWPVAM